MDVLEHYVHAVRTFLPRSQQDDIGKELSANIQAQMDDRETKLGRALSEAEQEDLLQQHGHPMIVAGRYQTNQGSLVFGRQLIGPSLFPLYLKVFGFTLGISLALSLLVRIALSASGTPITFEGTITTMALQIFFQFAIVTFIFAMVQHALPTFRWNAHRRSEPHPVVRVTHPIPRQESIAQIVALIVVLFWVWVVFERLSLLIGPASENFQIGSIWQQVVAPTVLIFVVSIAQAVVTLFRPAWMRFRLVVRLGTECGGLLVLVFLLRAGHWVVLVNGHSGNALLTINAYVSYGLWTMVIGFSLAILIDAWKLLYGKQERGALIRAEA